jgi:hypothetical protein
MGHKGPLTIVSPSEWRDRTSLRMSSRSASTKKVDDAYAAFYENTRDAVKGKALYDQLTAYVKEKGGDWRRADRDQVSGGLMKYIHDTLGAAYATPKSRAQAALEATDIPHSRYGVLYLLGNIDIDMNKLSIGLEGVGAVGGAVGGVLSTNFDYLKDADKAEKTFDLGSLKKIKASDVSQGGTLPFQVATAATSSTGTKLTTDSRFGAVHNPMHRPGSNNPAILKVYREAPKAKRVLPGFPCTRGAFDLIAEDPLLMLNPYTIAGTAVMQVGAVIVDVFNNLRVLLINAVTDLFNWIKSKILADGEWAWNVSGKVVGTIIKFVVGKCLESAAPLIGGAMDIGQGLMQTIKAAKDRIGTWLLRRKIDINPGHPELLANSIEACMTKGLFAGLWTILKGVASTALAVFLPGAGSLVSALVTGIEWMVKFIWRIWEQSKISDFLKEARGHFKAEKTLAEAKTMTMRLTDPIGYRLANTGGRDILHPELDKSKGGIITDLPRFKKFYQKGCDASPLIPMLTLNSGVCGSLMVLLKMFNDAGDEVSKTTYATGDEYFTKLKQFGRGYMGSAGFEFKPLDASNTSVRGLLNHAVEHHTGDSTAFEKFLAFGSA